jgi:hypothetical protein
MPSQLSNVHGIADIHWKPYERSLHPKYSVPAASPQREKGPETSRRGENFDFQLKKIDFTAGVVFARKFI